MVGPVPERFSTRTLDGFVKSALSFSSNDLYRLSMDQFAKENKRNGHRSGYSKSNSFGSSHHSAFRRAICRCLPSFFDLALSMAAILPS